MRQYNQAVATEQLKEVNMRQRYGVGQFVTRDSREHKRNVEMIAECVGVKEVLKKGEQGVIG